MISFQPTEEQEMICGMVRDFASKELREKARDCDEDYQLPDDLIAQSLELGLIAGPIPEEYGGGGLPRSPLTSALILEELGYGCVSLGAALMSPCLFLQPLLDFGTEDQKQKFLPMFTGGEFPKATMALTEPRFDFDAAKLRTTAERRDGSWVLNGEKCQVPLADRADVFLVLAEESGGGRQAFIVPRGAAGLTIAEEEERTLGFQSLPRGSLSMKDVTLPADARLGGDQGVDAQRIINSVRVGGAALAVGISRAITEFSIGYAKERVAFGEPIGKKQAIAFKLADMHTEVETMRWMVWKAASQLEQGSDATRSTTLAQNYASRKAMKIADEGVQILGGHGYIRDFPVEMWFRNTRALTLIDGPVAT